MKWSDVISATHGVFFTSQEQVSAWEHILKKSIPDVSGSEICHTLHDAMERDLKPAGWRLTVKDLIGWVKSRRNGWMPPERYCVGNTLYCPDVERVCGQIRNRTATVEEVEICKRNGKWRKA